jgi:hypothetical protein
MVVEDGVENFSEHELDRGAVLEEGNLDGAVAEGEVAVAVGVAEIAPVEGGLAALDAFGGEVAAVVGDVAVGFAGGGWDGAGGCI